MDGENNGKRKHANDMEAAEDIINPDTSTIEETSTNDSDIKNVFGWVALALGIIAFFLAPYLLAISSIILGFIARSQGAHVLGNSAIIISILAIIVRMFMMPLI